MNPALRAATRGALVLYGRDRGRLLGHRFLLLTHTGRRSGSSRAAVLEVVGRTAAGGYVVVSGLGRRSDWLRNLEAGGPAAVTVAGSEGPVRHRVLAVDEAAAVLGDYERRHRLVAPVVRRVLSGLLGERYRGTPDDRRRAVTHLPLVALEPCR